MRRRGLLIQLQIVSRVNGETYHVVSEKRGIWKTRDLILSRHDVNHSPHAAARALPKPPEPNLRLPERRREIVEPYKNVNSTSNRILPEEKHTACLPRPPKPSFMISPRYGRHHTNCRQEIAAAQQSLKRSAGQHIRPSVKQSLSRCNGREGRYPEREEYH